MAGTGRSGADPDDVAASFDAIQTNIESVIRGKSDVIRLALVAMLAEGHVLLEDVPGTGKSLLARAIAGSIDATVTRVQCTPDLLPADITGTAVLEQKTGTFEFRPGPVFTNVLLADEVNRATPKTQSALLEAMAERHVTVDGTTHGLPGPFLVLATQNPIEQAGTFPLPEAQLDRFLFRLSMGYPARDAEYQVTLDNRTGLPITALEPVTDAATVLDMIAAVTEVEVAEEVGYYAVDLVRATREDDAVAIGGSPRATVSLVRAARALAASDGRASVVPDDVHALLRPVLTHRIQLTADAVLRGDSVDDVMARASAVVPAPGVS